MYSIEHCLNREKQNSVKTLFIKSVRLSTVQFHATATVLWVVHSLVGAPQLAAVKALYPPSTFLCPWWFPPFLHCVISAHLCNPLSLIKSLPYSVEWAIDVTLDVRENQTLLSMCFINVMERFCANKIKRTWHPVQTPRGKCSELEDQPPCVVFLLSRLSPGLPHALISLTLLWSARLTCLTRGNLPLW